MVLKYQLKIQRNRAISIQAAIGGIPLAMGLACGNLVLAVAVLAILITAPLGAFMIDCTYKRFLTKG